MTIKQFFQNLGYGIAQGWASLRNRISSHGNDEGETNPLYTEALPESDESYEKPQSSTALVNMALVEMSDPLSEEQPENDFDANFPQEGIIEHHPTLSERVTRGASKVWHLASSIFQSGDKRRSDKCEWLDERSDRKSYSSLDDSYPACGL